jgi:methyltransferase-like protein
VLQRFPDDEFMLRDQYQDFVDGYGFRRTLLCHDGLALQRSVDMDLVHRFYLFGSSAPVDEAFCLTDASDMEFRTLDRQTLRVSHPVLKAAYLCLGRAWPRSFTFDELLGEASRLLDLSRTLSPDSEEAHVLAVALYVVACSGEITFQVSRPSPTMTIGDRPLASALARKQAESDRVVTNLLHQSVGLENEQACRILQLLDGTRTFDELVAEISKWDSDTVASLGEGSKARDPVAVSTTLQKFLKAAGKLGLLLH